MAKRPVKASLKHNETTASLIGALKFVSVAQKLSQIPFSDYCFIGNRRVVAFDGLLAAGAIVDNDLSACPHSQTLLTALQKCGAALAITQLASGKLSIKSGSFKAAVNCSQPDQMASPPEPDAPIAPLGDSFKEAVSALAWIVAEKGDRFIECSMLFRQNTAIATDGKVAQEYWHGWNMPEIVLPYTAAIAVVKSGKTLKAFGYSGYTITFWFEDDSWIKSQLYLDKYPNVDKVLENPCVPQPIPEGFEEALKSVADFTGQEGSVIFDSVGIRTSAEDNNGAEYEIGGFPNACFNIEYLQSIASFAKSADFKVAASYISEGGSGALAFFGDKTRGALAPMRMPIKSVENKAWNNKPAFDPSSIDDDIPF